MYQIFKDGKLHSQHRTIPRTIAGCKISNIQNADPKHLASRGIVIKWVDDPVPDPPTAEELALQFRAACMDAAQSVLDNQAKQYGFESHLTARSWGKDRPYGAELKAWGKAVWEALAQLETDVATGKKAMPKSVEAVLAEMPVWADYEGGA